MTVHTFFIMFLNEKIFKKEQKQSFSPSTFVNVNLNSRSKNYIQNMSCKVS